MRPSKHTTSLQRRCNVVFSGENLPSDVYQKRSHLPASPHIYPKWEGKLVIRLHECGGWPESLLRADIRRYVSGCCDSYCYTQLQSNLVKQTTGEDSEVVRGGWEGMEGEGKWGWRGRGLERRSVEPLFDTQLFHFSWETLDKCDRFGIPNLPDIFTPWLCTLYYCSTSSFCYL